MLSANILREGREGCKTPPAFAEDAGGKALPQAKFPLALLLEGRAAIPYTFQDAATDAAGGMMTDNGFQRIAYFALLALILYVGTSGGQ